MPVFYKDIATCPNCGNEFPYTKVMSDAIKIKSRDLDLKPEYAQVNPLLYSVLTCPFCKFTYNESDKTTLKQTISPKQFEQINKYLGIITDEDISDLDNSENKSEEFYAKQIIMASEIYATLKKPFAVARLFLKLSWYFREKNEEDKELKMLAEILTICEKYFEKAVTDEDTIFCLFYTGYAYFRFGEKLKANSVFDKLIRGFGKSKSPYIIAAKDIRSDLK